MLRNPAFFLLLIFGLLAIGLSQDFVPIGGGKKNDQDSAGLDPPNEAANPKSKEEQNNGQHGNDGNDDTADGNHHDNGNEPKSVEEQSKEDGDGPAETPKEFQPNPGSSLPGPDGQDKEGGHDYSPEGGHDGDHSETGSEEAVDPSSTTEMEGSEEESTSSSPIPTDILTTTTKFDMELVKMRVKDELKRYDYGDHSRHVLFDGDQCCHVNEKLWPILKEVAERSGDTTILCPGYAIANGRVEVHDDPEAFPCVGNFDETAKLEQCGGVYYYDQLAYCLKVRFFGANGVKEARKMMNRTNPTTLQEYRMNWLQDQVLVIVEGCLECIGGTKGTDKEVLLMFILEEPAGPISQLCPENELLITSSIEYMMGKDDKPTNFIIGGILKDRLCPSRKLGEATKLAQLSYRYNVKIIVMHDCGGKSTNHTIFLQTIEVANLKDNVFQLRQLHVQLEANGENTNQIASWDWNKPRIGMGYNYFVPTQNNQTNVIEHGQPMDFPDGMSGVISADDEKSKI